MKNIIEAVGFMIILFYLTGCAGTASGPSYEVAKAKQIKPDHAVLYVFREYAEPTLWGATIHIDGKEVRSLSQGGFTWVYAKPGKRNITAVWSGMASQRDADIAVKLVKGETYYIELTGVSRADLVGGEVRGNKVVTYIDAEINSGLKVVKPVVAEQRLIKCCKFQKPASLIY